MRSSGDLQRGKGERNSTQQSISKLPQPHHALLFSRIPHKTQLCSAVHYFGPGGLNININFCLQTPGMTSLLPLPSYIITLQGERRAQMDQTFSCKPKTSLLWLPGGSLSSQIHQLLIPNKAKKIFLSLIRSAAQFSINTQFNNQTYQFFFCFQIVQQHIPISALWCSPNSFCVDFFLLAYQQNISCQFWASSAKSFWFTE